MFGSGRSGALNPLASSSGEAKALVEEFEFTVCGAGAPEEWDEVGRADRQQNSPIKLTDSPLSS